MTESALSARLKLHDMTARSPGGGLGGERSGSLGGLTRIHVSLAPFLFFFRFFFSIKFGLLKKLFFAAFLGFFRFSKGGFSAFLAILGTPWWSFLVIFQDFMF